MLKHAAACFLQSNKECGGKHGEYIDWISRGFLTVPHCGHPAQFRLNSSFLATQLNFLVFFALLLYSPHFFLATQLNFD